MEKETQLNQMRNQFGQLEERLNQARNQKDGIVHNYGIKLEAKTIQINMLEDNFRQYKRENQNYLEQVKKQMELSLGKNHTLEKQAL